MSMNIYTVYLADDDGTTIDVSAESFKVGAEDGIAFYAGAELVAAFYVDWVIGVVKN